MTQNVQRLKAEIIATLDSLSVESLKLLAEFVTFLQEKASHPRFSVPNTQQQQSPSQNADPILQLGKQPVVEDVTDASIYHDTYLYSG
jgi:hypothetical protein